MEAFSARFLNSVGRHGPVVLTYHSVVDEASEPAWKWAVSLTQFKNHLDIIDRVGARTSRIRDLSDRQHAGGPLVILTFDDGYADNFKAFEALRERNMVATWFVVTSDIGREASWATGPETPKPMLGAEQLREMHEAGMEIGSHGCTHRALPNLDDEALERELRESRKDLEALVEGEIVSVAYPYGRYDARVLSAAGRAGYRYGCTCRTGWANAADERLEIRRLSIFNSDRPPVLARKLAFGQNEVGWGALGRYFLGRARARLSRA